jgi:nucleoside-diphosphate-sugar epimerase
VNLAKTCKKAGVKRFVYSSSCSVYGQGDKDFLTENSPENPQTAYAECKTKVERDVSRLASKNFSPVFLRNATAYGASPRMRFDLVLNNLAGHAWCSSSIKMISDGTPWRPLAHIEDICQAFQCALEAPRNAIHNQKFNVGDTLENYQVKNIAKLVSETFPGCKLSIGKSDGDTRSYKVSFEKIRKKLPGFQCKKNIRDGARELHSLFKEVDLDKKTFEFRAFTRLKQLEYLIKNNLVDEKLYWRKKT